MSDSIHMDAQSGYDRWSAIYDTEVNPLIALEEPIVRQWAANLAGSHVADVGCGTGRHTTYLAQSGAQVDAYDFSPGMMAKAMEKLDTANVAFHQHVFPNPLPVKDNTFDLVIFALVADHIEDLPSAFKELHRVVKPKGKVIFTVLHPAMNELGLTARFTDPDSSKEVRVAAFQHPYDNYLSAVISAGFNIMEIKDSKADEALAAQAPRARKYLGHPMLLAMKLRK